MERRNMIGGGLAGLTGLLAADASPAVAAAQRDDAAARELEGVRGVLARHFDAVQFGPNREISLIRQQQRLFLRSAQKYPDFLEVGIDVWEAVYDWLIRHHQPVTAGRMADGRYGMTFMFTTLLLRPEQAPNYVGFGFDGQTPPAAPVR